MPKKAKKLKLKRMFYKQLHSIQNRIKPDNNINLKNLFVLICVASGMLILFKTCRRLKHMMKEGITCTLISFGTEFHFIALVNSQCI